MEEGQGNRDTILSTALRLFSDRGYEAVGVAELCDESGITKPTLYHYFGSKRGLLDAIVAERGAVLRDEVRAASAYDRDVRLGIERIAFAFARSAEEDASFARLRLALAFAPPSSEGWKAGAQLNAELFGCVEAFFRAAAEDHGNMKGRSRPYAASFIGTIDTYVGLYLAGQAELSEDVVRGAIRQFMYGIFS
jgi:TetR/AcrR family transcriptional regulator